MRRAVKSSKCFWTTSKHLKSENISLSAEIRLYESSESQVISAVLYGAESWPLSVTQMKLEAAHHRFQRKVLSVTRKDEEKNEDIRKKSGLRKIGN